jgi:hypothetical protein
MVKRRYVMDLESPREYNPYLDRQSQKVSKVLESWRLEFESIAANKCHDCSLDTARQSAAEVLPILKLRWCSHNDDNVDCSDILKRLQSRAEKVQLIILAINAAYNEIVAHGLFSDKAETRLYMMGRVLDHYHVPHRLTSLPLE